MVSPPANTFRSENFSTRELKQEFLFLPNKSRHLLPNLKEWTLQIDRIFREKSLLFLTLKTINKIYYILLRFCSPNTKNSEWERWSYLCLPNITLNGSSLAQISNKICIAAYSFLVLNVKILNFGRFWV